MFGMEQTGSPSDFENVTSSRKWVGEPDEAWKGRRAGSSTRGSTRGPRVPKKCAYAGVLTGRIGLATEAGTGAAA